ncbi:MAG: zinc-dependent dehydrogenase [Candidatus Nanopelagicales bacterium]
MKAAVFHAPGDIRVEDVPEPTVPDDGILVRVRAASICGTDLRISKHGHFKIPQGQHRVLGHEIAGDIVAVGHQVETHAVGERVSVTPNVGCGRCEFCLVGLNNMCPDYEAFGVSMDGAFEELMAVPGFALQRGNVFRIPDGVSYADAALTEPFSCCYRGQQALHIGMDDSVLVVGAGPIGIFHLLLSRLSGARRTIVANAGRPRLDIAERLGADVTVDVTTTDLADVVEAETGGRGVDVAITCVSAPQVQSDTVQLLATHGRLNFFAGLGGGEHPPIDTNRLHYKGLVLTGTTGSSNADYAASLQLVADGRVRPSDLVTMTVPLEGIADAFEHSASGAGMKAMVVFDGEDVR